VKLQRRWFGVSKKMLSLGKNKPRWIIVNSYNFPQGFEIKRVNQILEKILNRKFANFGTLELDKIAFTELKDLKTRVNKLSQKVAKNAGEKKKLRKLSKQLKFLEGENRTMKKQLFKSQIPVFEKIIKDASKELGAKGEAYFQRLFEKNNWIFGGSYEEVVPKRKADPKHQPDFALKRYDGFCDIVEIESPKKPLFTKPNASGKTRPTAKLMEAISQAMDYIESYNERYKTLFYDDSKSHVPNPLHAYYPKGIVIIGQDNNTDRKKLRQLNNFLHNITVLTYDEFLKSTSNMLSFLKKNPDKKLILEEIKID